MNATIHYCHPGYAPADTKNFLVGFSENPSFLVVKFKILDSSSNVVYEGIAEKFRYCEYTGEILYKGDFSAVAEPGQYQISLTDFDAKSHLFEISDGWLSREVRANIKSFYYQRSGVELPEQFAGAWARPAAHLDDKLEFHLFLIRQYLHYAQGTSFFL